MVLVSRLSAFPPPFFFLSNFWNICLHEWKWVSRIEKKIHIKMISDLVHLWHSGFNLNMSSYLVSVSRLIWFTLCYVPCCIIWSSQHNSCTKCNLWCICWYSDLSRDKRRRCQEAAGCGNLHLQWPNDAYQEGSELSISNLRCNCLNFLLHSVLKSISSLRHLLGFVCSIF